MNLNVINFQTTLLRLAGFANLTGVAFNGPSIYCVYGPYGSGSLQEDPLFVDSSNNDYNLSYSSGLYSPCVNQGSDVGGFEHYETGLPITFGPDYRYEFNLIFAPDIGADEAFL